MIEIVCDNCETPFDVDPETSGPKVACPECGDVNRVPGGAAPSAPAGRRRAAERELAVVRPAMFRAKPFRYTLIVVLMLGGLVGAVAAWRQETGQWLAWPSLAVTLAAGVWFGAWWLSTHFWVRLIISDKRTVRHEGIVRRHTTEVLHDHVRSVDIRQNFVQRLLDVGSIGIDSAGQEDIEIEIHDIPKPYEIKGLIDRHRKM